MSSSSTLSTSLCCLQDAAYHTSQEGLRNLPASASRVLSTGMRHHRQASVILVNKLALLYISHLSPSFLSSLYSQPMTEEGHGFPGAIATSSCKSPNMRKPNLGPLGDLPNHSSSFSTCLFCFDPQNSCPEPMDSTLSSSSRFTKR